MKIFFSFVLILNLFCIINAQTYPARGLDYNQLEGGIVIFSSELAGYPAASIFQGDRIGQNCTFVSSASRCWGKDAGWADNTPGVFPDYVGKIWASPHSAARFVITTFQDNYSTPRKKPYFGLRVGANYGIEKFDVQILTLEGGWLTVATIDENYDIIREVNIDAITCKGSRVMVYESGFGYSTLIAYEVYGE